MTSIFNYYVAMLANLIPRRRKETLGMKLGTPTVFNLFSCHWDGLTLSFLLIMLFQFLNTRLQF